VPIVACAAAPYVKTRASFLGDDAMRSLLSLGFLVALCVSANAATAHHQHRKHAVARQDHAGVIMSPVPYGAYAGPRPPVYFNDQPNPLVDSPYKNWGG
jgi:hypothetical protein